MKSLQAVVLTVYMKQDIAELSRVLQVLVTQALRVEEFDAHMASHEVTRVKGLDAVDLPVMRLAIGASVESHHEVERATKALNRLVCVLKVVVRHQPKTAVPRGVRRPAVR